MTTIEAPYSALILAGGRSSRMGGQDKGLQQWREQALLSHALARVQAQTLPASQILISANRNLDQYQSLLAYTQAQIFTDLRPDYPGPLAGMEVGLVHSQCPWLLCLPCDMPYLPADLAQQLVSAIMAAPPAQAAFITSPAGPQPVVCLLHRALLASLQAALDQGQTRVRGWLAQIGAIALSYPDDGPFQNFNHLSDLDHEQPPYPL